MTRTRLGEVLKVHHGYAFKGQYFSDSGELILLTPGNFRDGGGFKPKSGTEKYYVGPVPEEYVLSKNDLVVAMTEQVRGLLGSSALIPADHTYLHNQRIGRIEIVAPDKADKRFIYYLFNSPTLRDQIQATATGAKVRHTAPSRIENVRVDLPPLFEQQRVGALLGRLDRLIEVGERQIEIDEMIVRKLYEERFNRLRSRVTRASPGESEALPHGWRAVSFDELVDSVTESVDPAEVDSDSPYIGLEHIPRRSVTLRNSGRASDVMSRKLRFRSGDILFGKIRPYLHKVAHAPFAGLTSSDTIVLRPKAGRAALALAIASSNEFVDYAVRTSNGTKMPRANWTVLRRFPVLEPDPASAEVLELSLQTLVDHAEASVERSRAVEQLRDYLLPRLVAQTISLQDIAIEELPAL